MLRELSVLKRRQSRSNVSSGSRFGTGAASATPSAPATQPASAPRTQTQIGTSSVFAGLRRESNAPAATASGPRNASSSPFASAAPPTDDASSTSSSSPARQQARGFHSLRRLARTPSFLPRSRQPLSSAASTTSASSGSSTQSAVASSNSAGWKVPPRKPAPTSTDKDAIGMKAPDAAEQPRRVAAPASATATVAATSTPSLPDASGAKQIPPKVPPSVRTTGDGKSDAIGATSGPPTRRPLVRRTGVTSPLNSVDELFKWRPMGLSAKSVSTVPLSESALRRFVRGGLDRLPLAANLPPVSAARGGLSSLKRLQPPRLLLCHDFGSAYHPWEAACTGVSGDECPSDSEAWRFNHWAYVDVFVYYSHHRVTIPPVGYIHAGHRHGSLVLGTVVFEGDDGVNDLSLILSSFKTRAKCANQLATIAKFFGFDGWLINAEVSLPGGSISAGDLAAFIGDLTRTTRKVLGPVSEVIWYDAVARDGTLSWQNELNEENEAFFKAAGSIFTNFHWDRNAPVRSAVKAATRRTDVFMGVDVHGRNTFGGGGFNTHIALRAIKQGGTSAAIFAPAWTVEKCPPNVSSPQQMEERFWTGPSGRFGRECVAQYFRERPVVTDLPFTTSFDPGWGPRLVRNGVVKDDKKYFNLAQQQVQPSFMRTVVAAGYQAGAELSMSTEQAYNGSSSVKVEYAFSENRMLSGSFTVLRLLMASLTFPSSLPSRITKTQNGCLRVSYTYFAQCDSGPESAADDFGLVLLFGSPQAVVLLVGKESRWNMTSSMRRTMPRFQIHGKFVDMKAVVADSDRRAFGAPVEKDANTTGWMTRTFVLDSGLISSQRLVEVMVIVGGPQEQPMSVRPSPLITPTGSQGPSRHTSRMSSRRTSRQPSRSTSRAVSPTRNSDGERRTAGESYSSMREQSDIPEGDDIRLDLNDGDAGSSAGDPSSDVFGSQLLNRFRDSVGQKKVANESLLGSRLPSDTGASSTFGRRKESIPDEFRVSSRREIQSSRYESSSHSMAMRGYGGYGGGVPSDGMGISFEHMQLEEDISGNAAKGFSRMSSRYGTPRSGSQYGSRLASLASSRIGSTTTSRVGSLAGSRASSRIMSPTGTPMGGGGGALPMEAALASGIMSPSYGLRRGLDSGMTTPTRGSEKISELKSALMMAAGSMAGTSGNAAADSDTSKFIAKTVFLGGIRIELIQSEEGISENSRRPGIEGASLEMPLLQRRIGERPILERPTAEKLLSTDRLARPTPQQQE